MTHRPNDTFSIAGGKNASEADWYAKYVIPTFAKDQKAKGVDVTVTFQPSGVDDEQYKAKEALDLKSRSGADIVDLDGIWVGEFARAGQEIYANGRGQGNTPVIRDVLTFYETLVDQGREDKSYREATMGRDESFAAFAKGFGGADYASMSGGGYVLNPNTTYPQQAWELMQLMGSADVINALLAGSAKIAARQDVNDQVLSTDPFLSYIAQKVLPITHYRPGLAVYRQVALALQPASADIVSGKSVDAAAAAYQKAVVQAVGGADTVPSS